jgi:hypothetical protein
VKWVAGVVLLGLLVPASAYADDEAEALYRDGKKAAQAKDWPTACAKFKASVEREPAPGTWLNLGDCEEHRGRLREARASFESSVRMFKAGDERGNYARQRLAAIERKIPKLTAKLGAGSPADARIDLDGAPLSSKDPVALEPGEHVLVVHASGRSDVESRITLAESENRTVVLNVGTRTTVDAPAKLTTPTPTPPAPPPREGSGLRTTGWVVLGVGAAGVATGLFAGLMTMNAKSDADANCPEGVGCNEEGRTAQSSGKTWSAISTTAVIAGGAAAALGITFVILGSSSKTTVGINPTGVTYNTTF